MNTTVSLLNETHRLRPWLVRWYGEPNEKGKQRRYSKSFRYRHEARAFQTHQQAAFNQGEPRDPVDVMLKELVTDFEEVRLSTLSYSSQIGYHNTTNQLLAYFRPTKKVREIRVREAEAFIATRKRTDGKKEALSTWSRARHLINCRAIFTAAVSWGYADENPFRVDHNGGRSSLQLNPKGKPWQHIVPEGFRRFIVVVPTPQRRAAYWLMYGCGLRAGEVYNLIVSNVDLDRRRVHVVNRAGTKDVPPFNVKAEGQSSESKERSVPIPEVAIPDLADSMGQAFKAGGFLVLTPERFQVVKERWSLCREGQPWGGHAWRPWQNRNMTNNVLRDAKASLRKAGIELTAPFTLYTFRKSFAQNHADAGTPPRTLARLLGHANTRVTMQFYNRVTDANERAAAKAMDQMFSRSGRGKEAM